MKTLLSNVRLISPDLDLPHAAILWQEGVIRSIHLDGEVLPRADRVIDGRGRMAMPGFIDIHSHGADGRDVCDDSLDSIRHIARRKLDEGVTSWLPTTLTQPQERLESIAAKCATYMAAPEFCRTPGLHVEGPFINREKAGAQNPEFVREPDFEELRRLHRIAPAAIVSLAPEMPGASEFIRQATSAGIRCSAAHSCATAAQLATAKQAGLRHLTHFANAMTPLHHREIGAVGMGLLDEELMLELICDGIHLCPDMLRLVFKLVPVERLLLITDSMAASWIGQGEVTLGGLEVVVRDHCARLKSNGALAGSALKFNEGLRLAAELSGLPLAQLVKASSWNQARALGLEGLGRIEPGFLADLVLLDPDFSIWKTLVGGEERNPTREIASPALSLESPPCFATVRADA